MRGQKRGKEEKKCTHLGWYARVKDNKTVTDMRWYTASTSQGQGTVIYGRMREKRGGVRGKEGLRALGQVEVELSGVG